MEDTCLSNVSQLSMRTPRLRTQLELKTDRLPRVELLNSDLSDGPKITILILESFRVKKLLVSQSLALSITFKIKVFVYIIYVCVYFVYFYVQYM